MKNENYLAMRVGTNRMETNMRSCFFPCFSQQLRNNLPRNKSVNCGDSVRSGRKGELSKVISRVISKVPSQSCRQSLKLSTCYKRSSGILNLTKASIISWHSGRILRGMG